MTAATFGPPPLPADIRLMNATAGLLAALGVAAMVAMGLAWAARQPVFAVRSIELVGDLGHNNVLTIRANAVPYLAGNFFTMDLAAARRAFEAVPWVRRALVRKVWPNRLRVELEEHRPVALWAPAGHGSASGNGGNSNGNGGNGSAGDDPPDRLVDSQGDVFEANLGDVQDDGLPTLRGPDGSSAQLLAMLGRLQPVFAPLDAHVDELAVSARGSWRAELDTGARLELGRGSEAEVVERTRRFVDTVSLVARQYKRPVEYADLRHNDGYAVRLRGISTAITTTTATTAARTTTTAARAAGAGKSARKP